MTGYHEGRLRAATASVHDADILAEMAVGWRTAIGKIKVSENHLDRVLTGLEDREQLGRQTRAAATEALIGMADHLRERRRVLGGTARALDDASAAMSRAVRLVESWDRAGALVDPGPAPQPDPLAKPEDDQSAYLAALTAHNSRVTSYNDALAQREESARRGMEDLQRVFASSEDKIRLHHEIPTTRLTREQQEQARLRQIELERQLEEERRAFEARRLMEERRRLEEERRLEEQRRAEERARELARLRERDRLRELDPTVGPTPFDPGRPHHPGGTLSTVSHSGPSHLAGSSSPALITTVSGDAQSGIALTALEGSSGAAGASGPLAGAAATSAAPTMSSVTSGLLAGPTAGGGAVGGSSLATPSTTSRPGGSTAGSPASAAGARKAMTGGATTGGATSGGAGAGSRGAGSRGGSSGAGSAGGRGARGAKESRDRPEVLASDSEWFDDTDAAPGVLG